MIECNSIEEVRENINQIDEEIVKLIAKRGHFVKQAAKFKKNTNDVKAPARVEEVINKVKNLAKITGANEEVVENIYRTMIDSFINAEMNEFEHLKNKNGKFQWFYSSNKLDWEELANLYKIAPLGERKVENLKISFANSKYKCSGMTLQNVPSGDESEGLPNVRKLFVTDEGMEFFDIDLDSADLRIVVWL